MLEPQEIRIKETNSYEERLAQILSELKPAVIDVPAFIPKTAVIRCQHCQRLHNICIVCPNRIRIGGVAITCEQHKFVMKALSK